MSELVTVFKFLHVLAAMAWVGAGLFDAWVSTRLFARGEEVALAWIETGVESGNRYYAPAAMSTLLFGVLTVLAGPWSFTTAWIAIGFGGILGSILLGAVLIGRAGESLEVALRRDGLAAATTQSVLRRLRVYSLLETSMLLVVVWAMVAKPGG